MRKIVAVLAFSFTAITFFISMPIEATSGEIGAFAQAGEGLDFQKAYNALDRRFVADDQGVVTDRETGLEWFVGPDRDTTWDEAVSWVKNLSVDSGGWRMPTREEIKCLYKDGAGTYNMSPLFETSGEYVWTGETVGSLHAWGFCFSIGSEYWPRRTFTDASRAFAVRSRR